MNITIYLNNGLQFDATVEGFNGPEFAEKINNQHLNVLSIGDVVINKHAIMMIVPSTAVKEQE